MQPEIESEALPFLFSENQDLIRASVQEIEIDNTINVFRWLNDNGPYPRPISIQLDLTHRCNGRCTHCEQWKWPRQADFSDKQLQELFEIFNSWKVRTIIFSGGNPLLYENIELALSLSSHFKIAVGIISEGLVASDALNDAICRTADWIRFSLDGPTPDIHDRIRNRPGLFDIVLENISKIKSRKKRPQVGVNCVIQKKNVDSLAELVELSGTLGVDTLLFKLPHGNDKNNHYLLSADAHLKLIEWVNTQNKKKQPIPTNIDQLAVLLNTYVSTKDAIEGRPLRRFYENQKINCFAPLLSLTCDPEGFMYPCCYLHGDNRGWDVDYKRLREKFCLGNVLDDSNAVLDRAEALMRNYVHTLPGTGYEECGSCTRHCQLNTSMTYINRYLLSHSSKIDQILKRNKPGARQRAFL